MRVRLRLRLRRLGRSGVGNLRGGMPGSGKPRLAMAGRVRGVSLLVSSLAMCAFVACASLAPKSKEEKRRDSTKSSPRREPTAVPFAKMPRCLSEPLLYPAGDPESVIAELVKDLSDDEIVARLVFAEALASRCLELGERTPEKARELTESIAWVVWNRVRAKSAVFGTGARGVVLKKAQFRSTFGRCDVAKRMEFLCPNENELWDHSVRAMERAKAGAENPLPRVHHYFFTRHFDESKEPACARWKGVMPGWTQGARVAREISADDGADRKACAIFYRL